MSSKLLIHTLCVRRRITFLTFYRLYQNDNRMINDPIPGLSISHIRQTLKQKQITSIEGYACITIECPICDFEKSKKARIYINKTTGK